MGNRRELAKARKAVDLATATLAAVEALPRRKGSLVLWRNGVVWRRIGDDEWEPMHAPDYVPDPENYGTFQSSHVATSAGSFHPVTHLKRLPALDPEEDGDDGA